MNISNQLLEVYIFLAEYGFIAILKEMTVSTVPAVKSYYVAGQKPSHNGCDGNIAGLQQEMKVVLYQTPSVTEGIGFLNNILDTRQEIITVRIIGEYVATFNSPRHDMV